MINIDKLKLILWDFDDTLCIHTDHGGSTEDDILYHVEILSGKNAFASGQPNEQIKTFIQFVNGKGIKQGLISAAMSYQHMIRKEKWVKDKYDITLANYCVGERKNKIDMLIAIEKTFAYKKAEILIVDDNWETLVEAANYGFQACTPMEIVNYVNRQNRKIFQKE